MQELPVAARAFVSSVLVAAGAVLVLCLVRFSSTYLGTLLPLVGMVILANVAWPQHPHVRVNISLAMPIALASVLLLGPFGAPFVGAANAVAPSDFAWYARLYNAAMGAICAFLSGLAYVAVGGALLGNDGTFTVQHMLWPALVASAVYEVVNTVLIVAVIALTNRVSPLAVWFGALAELALPAFMYSTFGLILAVIWSYVGAISAVLVLAPLTVARWVFAAFELRQEAYEATMRSLIKSVETKDLYTRGHSERVSRASVLIGRRSGMREDRISSLRYAGMLHDVGKLGVPTSVLQKAGKLTEDEFEAIQQHTVRGREITKDLEFLGEAIEGIHLHHERIDGRGYPLGLKGTEIPEFARIIAVADAFDSMTTTRSYRGARSVEDAVVELRACKGSQFDPVMVESLVEAIDSEGWDVSDTIDSDTVLPLENVPSFASDDDDPTVAERLGLPSAAPDDASELDSDTVAHGLEEGS
jgi:hypothetical protein